MVTSPEVATPRRLPEGENPAARIFATSSFRAWAMVGVVRQLGQPQFSTPSRRAPLAAARGGGSVLQRRLARAAARWARVERVLPVFGPRRRRGVGLRRQASRIQAQAEGHARRRVLSLAVGGVRR